jgi:hypothetical protein
MAEIVDTLVIAPVVVVRDECINHDAPDSLLVHAASCLKISDEVRHEMDAMATIFGAKVNGLCTRGQSCGNAGTRPGGLQVLAPTPWQSTVAAAPPAWAVALMRALH